MTETCHKVRDAIALEGTTPTDKTLRSHIETCEECARFVESARQVELELDTLESEDVSDDVVADLLARPELTRPVRPRQSRQWMMGLAAAAAVGFVALNVTFLGNKSIRQDAPFIVAPGPSGGGSGGGRASSAQPKKEDADLDESDRLRSLDDELDAPSTLEFGSEMQSEGALDELSRDFRQEFRDNALGAVVAGQSAGENKLEAPKRKQSEGAASEFGENALLQAPASTMPAPAPPPADAPETEAENLSSVREMVAVTTEERTSAGAFRRASSAVPEKRVHVDPVTPAGGKDKNVAGSVRLRLIVDAEGNVVDAAIVGSETALDDAAKDTVMQWKYVASDAPQRTFEVEVTFPTEDPDIDPEALRSYLSERSQVEGLRFRDAKGYWANTYLPGDPAIRSLKARLASAVFDIAPHRQARPVDQPLDPPSRGALSLSVSADHRAIAEPSRLLLQVGITGANVQGRRRPPMNIGVVVDVDGAPPASVRALLEELELSKQMGDRFRLIIPGRGEVVGPEAFEHGPLLVALDEMDGTGSVAAALERALGLVHAGDDPTMPLGTSLVVFVTTQALDDELDTLSRLAHQSAVGGVPVSVVGVGAEDDRDDRGDLERLAMAGQGRRYELSRTDDAADIVERELRAGSRAVARALRLRIKLAAGVRLVDVLGSQPLSERQTARVKRAEKSIDLRLSRNLGIEADRGEDEDGIQILIPSFYAGDTHTILLDVVAERPGQLVEVTAKYKDLTLLRNTVARASTSLTAQSARATSGPLEANVLHNYSSFHLAEKLEQASQRMRHHDNRGAVTELTNALERLVIVSRTSGIEIDSDMSMLKSYIQLASSSTDPDFLLYLADSMRFAAASKLSPAAVT